MAFDLNNFTSGRKSISEGGEPPDQVIHSYGSDLDTLITIEVAAYFNSAYSTIGSYWIRKGDMLAVKDSIDDAKMYKLTAVTPDVTIIEL